MRRELYRGPGGELQGYAEATGMMSLAVLMQTYRPGSADWSWKEEFADLRARDGEVLAWLRREMSGGKWVGEGVLLGDDGRVWDGHHRLLVSTEQGRAMVPVWRGVGGGLPRSPLESS